MSDIQDTSRQRTNNKGMLYLQKFYAIQSSILFLLHFWNQSLLMIQQLKITYGCV